MSSTSKWRRKYKDGWDKSAKDLIVAITTHVEQDKECKAVVHMPTEINQLIREFSQDDVDIVQLCNSFKVKMGLMHDLIQLELELEEWFDLCQGHQQHIVCQLTVAEIVELLVKSVLPLRMAKEWTLLCMLILNTSKQALLLLAPLGKYFDTPYDAHGTTYTGCANNGCSSSQHHRILRVQDMVFISGADSVDWTVPPMVYAELFHDMVTQSAQCDWIMERISALEAGGMGVNGAFCDICDVETLESIELITYMDCESGEEVVVDWVDK
ncbi:hypothetical protein GGF32_002275 [Allomyces javanicus]|nr:hypothetical protein GGF32_002275 [Allomyces javanicus]